MNYAGPVKCRKKPRSGLWEASPTPISLSIVHRDRPQRGLPHRVFIRAKLPLEKPWLVLRTIVHVPGTAASTFSIPMENVFYVDVKDACDPQRQQQRGHISTSLQRD